MLTYRQCHGQGLVINNINSTIGQKIYFVKKDLKFMQKILECLDTVNFYFHISTSLPFRVEGF